MNIFIQHINQFIILINEGNETDAEKYFDKNIQPYFSTLSINDKEFEIIEDISSYLRFGPEHGFDLEDVKLYLFENKKS